MTMIAGGLAGASPHMISATVTAISRLVFEFKGMFMCLQAYDIFQMDGRLDFLKDAYRDPSNPPCLRKLCKP